MSLLIKYESGLSSTFEDITDRVRLYTLDVAEYAEEGSVAMSSMTIDDPLGDYDIKGWRRIKAFEDSATGSNTLIGNWFVADRRVIRGPFSVGAARQWVVSLIDQNTVLALRIFNDPSANRPAETDIERITWMLTQLGTPGIPTTDFFNTSGGVAMDAADYRGQSRLDVIDDCAQQSGKNYFVYTKDGASIDSGLTLGLWYDFASSSAYTSSIRLSNVNSDIEDDPSGFTYAIAEDTELSRSPDRVYSGGRVNYDGGAVYEELIATSNEFTRRDAIVPAENVKTSATATVRALRFLADSDTEDDRITTAIRLPAEKVNWVRQGMRVRFRATHLPGYETFSYLRVLQRKVKQDSEQEYLVTLELGADTVAVTFPPEGSPDLTYAICNTESGGIIIDRSADGPEDSFDVGGTWYWELENTQHDEAAYTEFLKLFYGSTGQLVDLVAAMGGYGGPSGTANLQHPEDPAVCPYITLPEASGTFVIPSGDLGFHFQAKSQGYSAPCSAPYIAECWELRLWRISE